MVRASAVFSTLCAVIDAARLRRDGAAEYRAGRARAAWSRCRYRRTGTSGPSSTGEGDEEAAAVTVEIGGGRYDPRVGIAVLHVELAQQFAVEIEPVRIVDVGVLEEAQERGPRGADHVAELRIAEGGVADEIDGANLGGRALIDLEHDVDAVVLEIDDFRIDLRRVEALAAVDVENALHVRLHARARVDGAGLELDFGGQRVVLDLPVAFEGDPGDDRVLDHDDDDRAAFAPDANILEQAGGKQGFQGFVDSREVVRIADIESEIGADGFRLDALVAFDADGADISRRLGMGGKLSQARAHADRQHDRTCCEQDCAQPSSQPRPPHHHWCRPLNTDPPWTQSPGSKVASFCGRFWSVPPRGGAK